RRHFVQSHPRQPPVVHVHALLMNDLAIAVEEHALAGGPVRAHLVVGRQRQRRHRHGQCNRQGETKQPACVCHDDKTSALCKRLIPQPPFSRSDSPRTSRVRTTLPREWAATRTRPGCSAATCTRATTYPSARGCNTRETNRTCVPRTQATPSPAS